MERLLVYPDETYRTFLLGTADAETEAAIEEQILDGRIDSGYLQQVQEELIDDLLFGCLTKEEEQAFRKRCLATNRAKGTLALARALQHRAATNLPRSKRRTAFLQLPRLFARPLDYALIGALGCAVLTAVWFGERNRQLSHDLAQVTKADDQHRRNITQQQDLSGSRSSPPTQPNAPTPGFSPAAGRTIPNPVIRLSPGVNRGLATTSVVQLGQQTGWVAIQLELPFAPLDCPLREKLIDADGTVIWSQEFLNSRGVLNPGTTTLLLPAGLLNTGEYRLRLECSTQTEQAPKLATYLFRVRRN